MSMIAGAFQEMRENQKLLPEAKQLLRELNAIHESLLNALKDTPACAGLTLPEATVDIAAVAAEQIKDLGGFYKMNEKEADEIINEVVQERAVFTNNELPQKSEQPVKEYKNRIYRVDFERFSITGASLGTGAVEVISSKEASVSSLIRTVGILYPSLFSGVRGLLLWCDDDPYFPAERSMKYLVTSEEAVGEN